MSVNESNLQKNITVKIMRPPETYNNKKNKVIIIKKTPKAKQIKKKHSGKKKYKEYINNDTPFSTINTNI